MPPPAVTPEFEAPADWWAIDFISDLHLSELSPGVFDAWAAHMQSTPANAVFILGDLFEAWVGDDVPERSFEARCVSVLRDAASRKTVAFMAGNRDFLVGDAMLRSAGVLRLADPTVVAAFGMRALLSHGDALCLDDVSYQRYRGVVRQRWIQSAFLALPRAARETVGRLMRSRSNSRLQTVRPVQPALIIDLDDAATARWMRTACAPVLVHGHTHAPASHAVGEAGIRHVMTDWHVDAGGAQRAGILRWSAAGFARVAPETTARAT